MSTSASEQTAFESPIEEKLYTHPVYEHYTNAHKEHSAENPKSASVKDAVETELTTSSLKGSDKIALRSQTLFIISDKFLDEFNDIDLLSPEQDKNHSYTFFHLGDKLSGHPKIVHGGFIATLLDELTCGLGIQNFESKKAVTANLNIKYVQPCYTNSYVVVKCLLVERSGRKCIVRGEIYLLDLNEGVFDPSKVETEKNLISDCQAVIVEPRYAIPAK